MRKEEKIYDFTHAERGAVVKPALNKTRITIRVDTDVLNWFHERVHQAGGNYQTLINEVLQEHILQAPAKRKAGVTCEVMA